MLLWTMKSPSEYIAPFDEDRQTGLVQTVPAGGVVVGGVGVRLVVVAVGEAVGLEAVADGDAVAEAVGASWRKLRAGGARRRSSDRRVGVAVVAVGDIVGVKQMPTATRWGRCRRLRGGS